MPKTKDAFALANLAFELEDAIGEFSIPEFKFEPVGDEDDEDEEKAAETKAFNIVSDWINDSIGERYEMPPYRGFWRVQVILEESTAEIKRLQFILDCLDSHIARLRKYLLIVSKKITRSKSVDDKEFWYRKKDRASFLLWRYEWLKDVLDNFSRHIEKYIESQQENLQRQYKNEFAERLRNARRRKKISQSQVASLLNITTGAYSNYERGLRDLPMFTIYRLTEILSVSADYLFGVKATGNEI